MAKVCEGYIPPNTSKNTQWAVRSFHEWREIRNTSEDEQCPDDLLEVQDPVQLDYWLSRFVVEARRADGKPYPSTTLYQLLAGLLRFCRAVSERCPNFLDKKDYRFKRLHGACETLSRELRQAGVGAEVRHAAVISAEEEDQLWRSGVMGINSPKALLRAVFFYIGKAFCLRGGQEQRELKPSQFRRSSNPDHYQYVENGSKNHTGSFGKKDVNKVVRIHANPEEEPRCLVFILDLYFKKLPRDPNSLPALYLKPLSKTPVDPQSPWFYPTPIGRNMLGKFVQTMCEEAGISERKTNHSLRATGATALFNAEVPEKLIKGITGHKSSQALQLYERPSAAQEQAVSKVLTSGPGTALSKIPNSVANMNPGTALSKVPTSVTSVSKNMCTRVSKPNTSSKFFGSMFSGLSNCTINITPANFVVNLQQQTEPLREPAEEVCEEFDEVAQYCPDF